MSKYTFRKERVHYSDGDWADVSTVHFPGKALYFEDLILHDTQSRMRDAAHLRYVKARLRGEIDPVIVAWGCLEDDLPASQVFPKVAAVTEEGEHLLSANSLVTYTLKTLLERGWLHWRSGNWQTAIPSGNADWQKRAATIIGWLETEQRLWLETGSTQKPEHLAFNDFQPRLNFIPVGRCGFLSDLVRKRLPRAAFNAAYFLLEHDDFISHHSALGDPFGLEVHHGAIVRPPIYHRTVVWCGKGGKWQIGRIGMEDVNLILPGEISLFSDSHKRSDKELCFAVNPPDETEIALYTRYWGVQTQGYVLGCTPSAPGRIEFTIVDRSIMGWKLGGNLMIPQNGFVLSFATDTLENGQLQALQNGGQVNYAFVHEQHQAISRAIQNGPLLIKDGKSALYPDILNDEQYWISRTIDQEYITGVVPSDYPDDIDKTRAGRVGLGIDSNGDMLVVAISGVNSGMEIEGADSAGATLVELTAQLLAAGATNAINLDGGGSTMLFFEGGLLTRHGDRRGLPGVVYERMVPSVGVVVD